jgi:dimeric dUTPase (all-alpha-NTP-PPase superfamily)
LIERVPFKTWKSYSPEQRVGFLSEEDKLETQFEYIDMFHFFMNIGLLIGIDGKTFAKLYYLKNKENFDRQNRGY